MRHMLPWLLPLLGLLALLAVAALSPVEVRLRTKAHNDTLSRPRIDVRLLWGLIHLRPHIHVPLHPLRNLALHMGIPLDGDAARERASSGAPSQKKSTAGLQHAASGTATGHYLFSLTRSVAIHRLHLKVAFQTGDPARTAIAAGAAWGILGGLLAGLSAYLRYERPPDLEVVPLFSGPARLLADLDCILAARLGHVMIAALRGYLQSVGGTKRGDAA